jgi:RHS repeat-associated protein
MTAWAPNVDGLHLPERQANRKQTGDSLATATFFHADQLGSTRVCTSSSGDSAGTCDYEPFGEIQPGSSCSVPTNYRFAGMEWDADAGPNGLYYTWFRYYDHNQGRWMGVDPLAGSVEAPQSLDRYAYVVNDPANLMDPLGLTCFQSRDGNWHCPAPRGGGGWIVVPVFRWVRVGEYWTLVPDGWVFLGYAEPRPGQINPQIPPPPPQQPGPCVPIGLKESGKFSFVFKLLGQEFNVELSGSATLGPATISTTGDISLTFGFLPRGSGRGQAWMLQLIHWTHLRVRECSPM